MSHQKTSAVLGIDMGATHLRMCVLDKDQNTIDLSRVKTSDVIGGDLCANFKQLIGDKVNEYGLQLQAMVIGLPVTISKDRRRVLSTSNLKMDEAVFSELVVRLCQAFSCPVVLERDVNLQLAYDVHHAGLQDKVVLGCYLGTGFGFSIWLNGDLYIGAHGVAGELGHIPYGNAQKTCVCGNPGCLETVVSGMNLRRYYEKAPRSYPLEHFFDQANDDGFIEYFLDETAKAIATVINLFDPDVVILGGGVMDMHNFPDHTLKEKIMLYCRKPLPADQLDFIKAASSAFNGATGGALQALKLI